MKAEDWVRCGGMLRLLLGKLKDPNRYIIASPNDAFDVLPGHLNMYLSAKRLNAEHEPETRLTGVLNGITKDYDHILVDCPPAFNVVMDNALLGCRRVLIPSHMRGVVRSSINRVFKQIQTLESQFKAVIETVGIVPVGYETQLKQRAFLEMLRQHVLEYVAPVLRKRQSLIDACGDAGVSIFSYSPASARSHRNWRIAARPRSGAGCRANRYRSGCSSRSSRNWNSYGCNLSWTGFTSSRPTCARISFCSVSNARKSCATGTWVTCPN